MKHKKVCLVLSYVNRFVTLAVTGIVSFFFAFASLIGITI